MPRFLRYLEYMSKNNHEISSSWSYVSSAKSKLRTYLSGYGSLPRSSSPQLLNPLQVPGETKGWRAWIKEKRRGSLGTSGNDNAEEHVVNIFPGWAARRYARDGKTQVPAPFEVEVFVSGFACIRRHPDNTTRSQRAFIRLAKSFAGLPKIVENPAPYGSSLIATPIETDTAINEDEELGSLERELNRARQSDSDLSESCSSPEDDDAQHNTPVVKDLSTAQVDLLRRLHDNIEKRVQFLWYSALPGRTVRLRIFVCHHHTNTPQEGQGSSDMDEFSLDPENLLVSQDVTTCADGSFQARFRVKWEDLCLHPRALHIAFGETIEDHDLLVESQLLPASNRPSQSRTPSPTPPPTPPPTPSLSASSPLATITRTPITHSPIRVISDIDDTVKHSGILSGARAVFHNVFIKDLRDNVIPGMGEWYMKMFSKGVRFHYVSNGPFAILPLLTDFFHVSQLPSGSLKLRSYAGRSLFDGLLSAPAARKRSGVLEVLDSFPDSRFLLIGDTGEQDLELYADIARERPDQILGVFLRDARPDDLRAPEPLSSPTGRNMLEVPNPIDHPSASRSQSNSPSGSLASLLGKFPSYKESIWRSSSTPSLRSPDSGTAFAKRGPNSTRFTVDNVIDNVPSRAESQHDGSRSNPKKNPRLFSFGPVTSQPEEETRPYYFSSASRPESPSGVGGSSGYPSRSNSRSGADQVFITEPPEPILSPSLMNPRPAFFQRTNSSVSSAFESEDTNGKTAGQTSNGSQADELQRRVYRARAQMPCHIVLRVFRHPTECIEVDEILKRAE